MKKQTGECTPNFEVFLLLLVFVMLVGSLIMFYNGYNVVHGILEVLNGTN